MDTRASSCALVLNPKKQNKMKKVTVTIKHLLAVLKISKSVPKFLVYAKAIYAAMHSNASFAGSAAKLTILDTNISLLDTAQSGTKQKPATYTIAQRDVYLETVKTNLNGLLSDVQILADADPANARAIIESAAMNVKNSSGSRKRENSAKNGAVSGTVDLVAEAPGPHEWRWSLDGLNWTYLPATYVAKTSADGFTPLSLYYFTNRPILRNGVVSDWSVAISLRIA